MKSSTSDTTSESWWDRWPELLADELEGFRRHGVVPEIVLKRNGILVIKADWPAADGTLNLRIGFSSLHPFMRPRVSAPAQTFERHQHPLSRDLCLITQDSDQWISQQLVADFVAERLKQLFATLEARRQGRLEDAGRLEERVGDPLGPYLADASEPDSIVLFGSNMAMPTERQGLLDLAAWSRPSRANGNAFEAVLTAVKTVGGQTRCLFSLPTNPPDAQIIPARWIRFDPPETADTSVLVKAVEDELARRAVMQPSEIQRLRDVAAAPIFITGILFPEEVAYGQKGAGWLFLVSRRNVNGRGTTPNLVRGERAGDEDIFARLPMSRALRKKKVIIVGCGAIGSFVAVELARAGIGNLLLLDFDVAQPGNSLRWPLGRPSWGVKKIRALAEHIAQHYPWTRVGGYDIRIGETITDRAQLPPNFDRDDNPYAQLRRLIAEADIVIDATAMSECQSALAFHSRDLGVPYIMGHATLGARGGVVARFNDHSMGCWVCLLHHWADRKIPQPFVDDAAVVTPVGCNQPTFTGGNFDLQEVSLEIVRSAIGLLSGGEYDPGGWSVAILNHRGRDGVRSLPQWSAHDCPPHPSCAGCSTRKL